MQQSLQSKCRRAFSSLTGAQPASRWNRLRCQKHEIENVSKNDLVWEHFFCRLGLTINHQQWCQEEILQKCTGWRKNRWKVNKTYFPGQSVVSPTQQPSWRPGQGMDNIHWIWELLFPSDPLLFHFRLDHKFDLMYAKRAFVHWWAANIRELSQFSSGLLVRGWRRESSQRQGRTLLPLNWIIKRWKRILPISYILIASVLQVGTDGDYEGDDGDYDGDEYGSYS